jgi:DNA mismatch endonuclease (patch repair protein)
VVALGDGVRVPYPAPTSTAATLVAKGNRKGSSKPELAARSALHRAGLRFRVNHAIPLATRTVRPDATFTRWRIALFVDGCFWHGCPQHGTLPRSNADYWHPKLQRNRERDEATDRALEAAGWRSVRVWEHDPPTTAVERVQREIEGRRGYPRRVEDRGNVEQSATASAIRDAFVEIAARRPGKELPYRDLHTELVSRGWTIRGGTLKRQQDAVYGALRADSRIKKVRPGVFALIDP